MASKTDHDSIKSKVKPFEAKKNVPPRKKGAWTPEEDSKLAEAIAVHGAKRWKSIAAKADLNRNGKSCRLRWLNYLRPNIKRGNISDQEEDLILRLHKLLGNRWSLIAGRLPGRTDNEIKNYWNSHLCNKIKQREKRISECSTREDKQRVVMVADQKNFNPAEIDDELIITEENNPINEGGEDSSISKQLDFEVDGFLDFLDEGPLNLEWVSKFLELN